MVFDGQIHFGFDERAKTLTADGNDFKLNNERFPIVEIVTAASYCWLMLTIILGVIAARLFSKRQIKIEQEIQIVRDTWEMSEALNDTK